MKDSTGKTHVSTAGMNPGLPPERRTARAGGLQKKWNEKRI
jgi:hypothetical protein